MVEESDVRMGTASQALAVANQLVTQLQSRGAARAFAGSAASAAQVGLDQGSVFQRAV